MPRPATPISLTEEDRVTLSLWARSGTTEQRLALRARINLSGRPSVGDHRRAAGYAPRHGGKWRTRFAAHGLDRLQDAPRPGSPRRYDEDTEQRLIDSVSQPPPGHATRTAALLAETLGEVSVH